MRAPSRPFLLRPELRAFLIGALLLGCSTTPALEIPRVVVDDGTRLYTHARSPVQSGRFPVLVSGASWIEEDLGPLEAATELVCVDLRGRGRSDRVDDTASLSLAQDCADLEAVRARLGWERFSLLGWSYNAGLALHYALNYPERVERLVLVSPLPVRRTPYWHEFQERLALRTDPEIFALLDRLRETGIKKRNLPDFCRRFTEAFFRAYAFDPSSIERMRSSPCLLPNLDPDRASAQGQAILAKLGDWDWRSELANIEVPVLLIQGAEDALPVESSAELAELLPRGELLVVPECGHLPWIERPEIFFGAVVPFLAGSGATGPDVP